MGLAIDREHFDLVDYLRFQRRLDESLLALRLVRRPGFRAGRAALRRVRRLCREPFRIRTDGADPLELVADDLGLEGANTSFQVHLRVDPDRFADHFNAAQLATGPVLAVAGNSPTFLGHRLWEETMLANAAFGLGLTLALAPDAGA
jgi:hypothetical protein